jgi:hypothetical protein
MVGGEEIRMGMDVHVRRTLERRLGWVPGAGAGAMGRLDKHAGLAKVERSVLLWEEERSFCCL